MKNKKYCIVLMLILLMAVMTAALRYGSSDMSWNEFLNGLMRSEGYKTQSIILYSIRIPRILGGLLAGVGLSLSGVLLQCVTGNELAGPNIIGVNAGAGFMVILFLAIFPAAVTALPFAAFFGAFVTTAIIMAIAGKMGSSRTGVILAGIAFTSVLNAGISFISLLDTDVLTSYNYFSVGGLAGVKAESLIIPLLIIFLCLAVSICLSSRIDLLCLGDSMATSLGVRVKTLRMICLICASASAAAVVSFAGLLGFVGLVVPHIARKLVGIRIKNLIAAAVLSGGIIVIAGDLLGRILFAPSELPVGIMMALVGAPFFFILLLKGGGFNA